MKPEISRVAPRFALKRREGGPREYHILAPGKGRTVQGNAQKTSVRIALVSPWLRRLRILRRK
jgi:hypothetical protein